MQYNKKYCPVKILLISTISIVFFLFALAFTRSTLDYRGFALDTDGHVFVGKAGRIDVYSKTGLLEYSIFSKSFSRGYSFAILEDELYVSTGSYFCKLSLTGTLLEEYTGNPPYTYDQLQKSKWYHRTDSGIEYRLRFFPGITIVDSNSNILWREPIAATVIRLGLLLSGFFWIIAVLSFAHNNWENWYSPKRLS